MSKSPGASAYVPVKAPYHRPVATRHFPSDSKVTATRLSEMRASCRASWQSLSSSTQCFHWDRLYSGRSAGIGATVIVRVGAGLVIGVDAGVAGSRVGIDVAVSVEDAGVGVAVAVVDSGVPWGGVVGMMSAGNAGMELDSIVATTDGGVAAGVGAWPEQADRTMRNGRSAQSGSLVIRVLLSF